MKIFSSRYIYYQLMACIFLVAVIFIAIATVISLRIEIHHAHHKAEVMINQLIATIEPTAKVAVYANNTQIAQDVLEGLLHNDVVYKATISNDIGLLLEKSKGTNTDPQQEIIHTLISPFGDNQPIGQLRITPDVAFSLREANYVAFHNALNALILVGLTLLIMSLLIRSFFSKSLKHISHTLRTMMVSDETDIEPVKLNNNNELSIINQLIEEIGCTISTQQVQYKHIKSEERKLRSIFESTSAGLFLLNEKGQVIVCTPTLQKILGCEDVIINGQDFATLFFNEPSQFQQMMQNVLELDQLEAQDLLLKNNENNPLWVHCLLSKIDTMEGIGFEGCVFDISKRIAAEKAMHYQANHDTLTGLLRRNTAELQLGKHLASENSASTIVLLLDLDGFKQTNDTYGHDVGDIVLIQAARRLESCVRHNDIICRLGGDEFLIILFNCDPIGTGYTIAEKIINTIKVPVSIDAKVAINIGVSIGIALFPMHGTNVESLLKSADEAMYEVKRKGKNGYGIKNKNGVISVNQPSNQKCEPPIFY